MALTHDEARNTTTLTGALPDQAALHGLLIRIRDLGLPLLSLLQIEPDEKLHGDAREQWLADTPGKQDDLQKTP